MTSPIILIPARLASRRLPRKALADIAGAPMIVRVWRCAVEADVGPVAVATDDANIAAAITAAGGRAILTDAGHASGSDRISEAISAIDPAGVHDIVVNVQGDEPLIEPQAIRAATALMDDSAVDIGTLGAVAAPAERDDPNAVKVAGAQIAPGRMRALYFSRSAIPWGEGVTIRHIGLYAYRRAALARFVALPPSALELRERLEQLRALETGMRIDVALVESGARGVDTPADLERVRAIFAGKGKHE